MMTDNQKIESAWKYHDATKHSYESIRSNPHFLDWENQPSPFKIYAALEPISLPREVRQTGVAALSAIAESIPAQTNAVPDLEALAQILYLTAGITRQRKFGRGEIYFRAAACTGALYEVELYVVCGDLAGLEAGVYHFSPAEFSLRRLRAGDYRGALREAAGGEAAEGRGDSAGGKDSARAARVDARAGGGRDDVGAGGGAAARGDGQAGGG